MPESSKRIAASMSAADRLSKLPINVLQNIIGRMPIRDAARTSILSGKWRYVWAEYPELVLDKQFYAEIERNITVDFSGNVDKYHFQSKYTSTVNGILFQHLGPVVKFVLDIPESHLPPYTNIDQWLLFLSRKDVTVLTLCNRSPNLYKVPYFAFSCPKLASLNVGQCIFSAPKGLDGCRKLTRLCLMSVTFELSVLNFPQLSKLALQNCSGIHLLSVSAPSLQFLVLVYNDDLDLSYYMTCKDLVHVSIELRDGVQHHKLDQQITLTKLLGCWPKLLNLCLGGSFLKHLAAGNIPQRVPIDQLTSLVYLIPTNIVYNLDEVGCILCLLQSALKLSILEIWTSDKIAYDEKTLEYLKEPGLMKRSLEGLKTVIMKKFRGSTCELLLVKLLLGYSPSLERMFIEDNQDLDPMERLNISKELMQFSRASPKAEIFFYKG